MITNYQLTKTRVIIILFTVFVCVWWIYLYQNSLNVIHKTSEYNTKISRKIKKNNFNSYHQKIINNSLASNNHLIKVNLNQINQNDSSFYSYLSYQKILKIKQVGHDLYFLLESKN